RALTKGVSNFEKSPKPTRKIWDQTNSPNSCAPRHRLCLFALPILKMHKWYAKRARVNRGMKYLRTYSEDAVCVEAIVVSLTVLHANSARDVAESVAGRILSEEEWQRFGPRWERAWNAVVS